MPYIDRYQDLKVDNTIRNVPFGKLPELPTDIYINYQVGVTRFDNLAFKYYDDPTLGWLIGLANPEQLLEFDFDDGDIIRIPFPLDITLENYNNLMRNYYKF